MAKATQTQPSKSVTRRHILAGAVTATLAGGSVSHAAVAAKPLAAQPSELGLAFIAAMQEYRAAFQVAGDLSDADADAAADRMYAKIDPLRERIVAQSATSLTALVDKAIVAARDCNPDGDWTGQPGIMALVHAVCGLAGVDPAQAMA
jgi:hypothetical protein